ncbi:MAG: sulfotransferase, partial [Paracoccaceae bacterium]|nr:sulfotransferase [Paracoccaceae bacterium]
RKGNGDIQTAQEYYEKALAVKPDHVTAMAGLGYCRKAMGDFETAKTLYEKAVALAPDIPANQRSLAQLKKFKPGDPQIEQMEALLARDNNGIEEQISLNFAMAKIYEDVGEVQKSFDCLLEGNRLRKQSLDYKLSRDKQVIEKVRRRLPKAKLTPLDVSPEGPTPIFIVGMPRSGTTLTEQIIASHSKVYGAGELRDLNRLAMTFMKSDPLEQEAALLDVRRGYLDSIRELSGGAEYVTDKMPLNFRWVGLMRAAFPEAKIIHTNRDPMAVCWSIFQRNFTGRGNGYAYNIDDLANFYHLYQDLMAFWDEDMLGQLYQLNYKKLTENQEAESRALIEYCGLDWEDACLEFYKTKRAVLTASSTQVRQKMYTGSTEAWKKFETQLEPLRKALAV